MRSGRRPIVRRWPIVRRRWPIVRRWWPISGWWRPIGSRRPGTGYLVSLRIHALLIGHVVAPLEGILGRSGRTARDSGSCEEARPRTDCGAGAGMARGRADQRTEPRASQRSYYCSGGKVLIGGLARRCSAYLLLGPLPARIIISLEYLKRLSRARQHRDGRARGHWVAGTAVGLISLIHFFFALPMRRAERACLFLDLLEGALKRGQSVEAMILSIAESRDRTLGVRFHLLAAHIEGGLRFAAALEKVPRFLPSQISAMLRVGEKLGDLRRTLPACHEILRDWRRRFAAPCIT